jgi:PKD repeat protein
MESQNSPKARRRGSAGHGRAFAACCLALSSIVAPVFSAQSAHAAESDRARVGQASTLRSTLTGEFGVPHPAGLAYSALDGVLYVVGGDSQTATVAAVPPAGDRVRDAHIPSLRYPSTLAVDPADGSLTALDARTLVRVSKPTDRGQRVERVRLGALGLQDPQGAAYDPTTGTLLVLDAGARSIARLDPHALGTGPRAVLDRIPLQQVGGGQLRGLAYNSADHLVYIGATDQELVYGVDGDGQVRAVIGLHGTGLRDPRAMAFAPSADTTDAPTRTSLFVADAGTATGGGVTELSITATATTTQAATPSDSAVTVLTTDLSRVSPPSPDPAGIAYLPGSDRLLVSDSEVDEMSIFQNVNLYSLTRTGALTDTAVTTRYSFEPTGVAYNGANGHLFAADDDVDKIWEDAPGDDGRYGTTDDIVTSISTKALGTADPEDVAYDSGTGEVDVMSGIDQEVYKVAPGPNGRFDGVPPTGDDTMTHFDVGAFGAVDPEGLTYDPVTDHLFVLDHVTKQVYEVTREGTLVRTIDISSAAIRYAAGIAIAPASTGPGRNMYVVDRGVDNNEDPNENDGKLYELAVPGPDGPFTLDAPVATSTDDAEESESGSTIVASSTLDLVFDVTNQTVGMRFAGLALPPGALILDAYVQFQVSKITTGSASLTMRGQASDNTATFAKLSGNISSRPRTAASVPWVPAPWPKTGVRGFDQRTPNLAPVVQEIVNRTGWISGNALAIIVTGTGVRSAKSFDGGSAPALHVVYRSDGASSNAAPSVNAGPDQTLTLPNAATLSGTVTDDGLPSPPASVTTQWAMVNGPGNVTFGDPSARSTTATFSAQGTYLLRLTADDSALTASDDVTVTVNAAPPPPDNPPAAGLSVTPSSGGAPLTVTADASASTDTDATPIASYAFDFGDGTTAGAQPGATATHTYSTPGTYTVTVTVTDTGGLTSTATTQVTVNAAPPPPDNPPAAGLSVTPSSGSAPLTVTADASASTDTDATPIASYAFDFGDGTTAGAQPGATATHTYSTPGTYTLTVTVTDTGGLTSMTTQLVAVAPSNYIGNPGFETGLAGWNNDGNASITLGRVTGGHSGDWAAQLTNTGTSPTTCTLNDAPNWVTTTTAGTYTGRIWVRAGSSGPTFKLRFREYQSATLVGTQTATVKLTTSWQLVTVTYTPAAPGSSTLDFNALVSSAKPGTCFYADDASIRVS